MFPLKKKGSRNDTSYNETYSDSSLSVIYKKINKKYNL